MRNARSSDMRHKVKFYEQIHVRDKETKQIKTGWRYVFSAWCRRSTIFREQLESVISGANTYRDRYEMETRYTTKITSAHRMVMDGKMYSISITGDTSGFSERTRFLAERLEDGGV